MGRLPRHAWLPVLLLSSGSAQAQLSFEEVAQERGLDFEVRAEKYLVPELVGDLVIAMQVTVGNGAAVGDYDQDGDLDVYVLGHLGQANRLFRNELVETGEKRFTDVTEAPLDDRGLSRVAHFVDVNGDGWLDILLLNDHLADEFLPTVAPETEPLGPPMPPGAAGSSRRLGPSGRGAPWDGGAWDGGARDGGAPWDDGRARDGGGPWDAGTRLRRGDAGSPRSGNEQTVDVSEFEGPATWTQRAAEETSPSRIFVNQGDGSFVDATEGSGFEPDGMLRCGASLADLNGDGELDVFVTNWSAYGAVGPSGLPGRNLLYFGDGAGRFDLAPASYGPERLGEDSFTALLTDLDEDGYKDIFVAVDHREDVFYFGSEDGFSEDFADQAALTHIGNDMGVTAGDFDDDGDLDIYSTNITDTIFGTTKGNALYVSRVADGGEFIFWDEALGRGVFDTDWGWGVSFFDPDNDGDLDIVAATGFDDFVAFRDSTRSEVYQTPNYLFRNDGTGFFARIQDTGLDLPDDSRALVVFDYDRDGDQDVLITNHEQPLRLFENTTQTDNHYLTVQLAPDSLAAGARVWASFDGVRKRRDVLIGDSYLAGTPREAHFGLGAASVVETLRVEWADGSESLYEDVAADQLVQAVAGEKTLRSPLSLSTAPTGPGDAGVTDAGAVMVEPDAGPAAGGVDAAELDSTEPLAMSGCECRLARRGGGVGVPLWGLVGLVALARCRRSCGARGPRPTA